MITPWEIYWVLQLDAIKCALALGCVACTAWTIVAFTGMTIRYLGNYDEKKNDRDAWLSGKRHYMRTVVPAAVALLAMAILLPSTKTSAAMVVVPQIVNSPTIQHEAGDLYTLAKQALRDAIAPKHKQ